VVYSSAHPESVSKPPFVTPSRNTKKCEGEVFLFWDGTNDRGPWGGTYMPRRDGDGDDA